VCLRGIAIAHLGQLPESGSTFLRGQLLVGVQLRIWIGASAALTVFAQTQEESTRSGVENMNETAFIDDHEPSSIRRGRSVTDPENVCS
jgi:hypothetical protein